MGRSVAYPSDSVFSLRVDVSDIEDVSEWRDWLYEIEALVRTKYPSFLGLEQWIDNELRVVCENQFCRIVVGEYCGLASISLQVHDYSGNYNESMANLANSWAEKNADGIEKLLKGTFPCYNSGGYMSNGEEVLYKC